MESYLSKSCRPMRWELEEEVNLVARDPDATLPSGARLRNAIVHQSEEEEMQEPEENEEEEDMQELLL